MRSTAFDHLIPQSFDSLFSFQAGQSSIPGHAGHPGYWTTMRRGRLVLPSNFLKALLDPTVCDMATNPTAIDADSLRTAALETVEAACKNWMTSYPAANETKDWGSLSSTQTRLARSQAPSLPTKAALSLLTAGELIKADPRWTVAQKIARYSRLFAEVKFVPAIHTVPELIAAKLHGPQRSAAEAAIRTAPSVMTACRPVNILNDMVGGMSAPHDVAVAVAGAIGGSVALATASHNGKRGGVKPAAPSLRLP